MKSGRTKAVAITGTEDFELKKKNYSSCVSQGVRWYYLAQ